MARRVGSDDDGRRLPVGDDPGARFKGLGVDDAASPGDRDGRRGAPGEAPRAGARDRGERDDDGALDGDRDGGGAPRRRRRRQGRYVATGYRVSPKALRRLVRLEVVPDRDPARPRTRADCVDGPRPCPWYGCKHHLGIEVNVGVGGGLASLYHREILPGEASCALDVAERGGVTLDEVGAVMGGLSRERVRQIEVKALILIGVAWKEID